MKQDMKTHIIKHVFLGLVIIAGLSVIIMLLWNMLIPVIFGMSAINLWQALGLFILARLFFGEGSKFRIDRGVHSYNNPVREKWMKMSEEERKEFIRHRHHHGHGYDFFKTEEPEKES